MLGAKCHRKYDREKFGWEPWNKGLKGKQKWHNISGLNGVNGKVWNKCRKETRKDVIEKLSKSHIGKIPWNKGIKQKDYLAENNLIVA